MRAGMMSLAAAAAFVALMGSAQAQSSSFQPNYDNSGNGITSLTGAWRNTAEYPNNGAERGGSSTGGFSLFSFGGDDTGFLPRPNAPTRLTNETAAVPVNDPCVRGRNGRCLR